MLQKVEFAPYHDFNCSPFYTSAFWDLSVDLLLTFHYPANISTDFMSAYSTYYYETVYSSNESFVLQIIQQVVSLLGNVCSWFIVDRLGRRNTQFYGLLLLTAVLMITAGLATNDTTGSLKGSCALIIFYCFAYKYVLQFYEFNKFLTENQRYDWSHGFHHSDRDIYLSIESQDNCNWQCLAKWALRKKYNSMDIIPISLTFKISRLCGPSCSPISSIPIKLTS